MGKANDFEGKEVSLKNFWLQIFELEFEADEKLKANNSEQIFSHICESAEYSDYGSRTIRLEVKLKFSAF